MATRLNSKVQKPPTKEHKGSWSTLTPWWFEGACINRGEAWCRVLERGGGKRKACKSWNERRTSAVCRSRTGRIKAEHFPTLNGVPGSSPVEFTLQTVGSGISVAERSRGRAIEGETLFSRAQRAHTEPTLGLHEPRAASSFKRTRRLLMHRVRSLPLSK